VAIGHGATVGGTHHSSVAIGAGSATTASRQVVLGSSTHSVKIDGKLVLQSLVNSSANSLYVDSDGVIKVRELPTASVSRLPYLPFSANAALGSLAIGEHAFAGEKSLAIGFGSTHCIDSVFNASFSQRMTHKPGHASA